LFLGTSALLSAFPSFSSHAHCANSQCPSVENSTGHPKKKKKKKKVHIKFTDSVAQFNHFHLFPVLGCSLVPEKSVHN